MRHDNNFGVDYPFKILLGLLWYISFYLICDHHNNYTSCVHVQKKNMLNFSFRILTG